MDKDRSDHRASGRKPEAKLSVFGSGTTFFLIALAVILAVIFFYLTKDGRQDRRADTVTGAAAWVDNAAGHVERAAQNVARDLPQDQ